ncbi:MAG: TIGR02996 domain-containing protein [Planctomycetes bacterium]|nr:TIGR02996 domain-containing protein [Planctomycetota bacterium]
MSGMAKCFLDDIVANIDEDTPRLVYADWLTENGQEDRGEFIRVQVERARLPSWDAAQVRLRLREQQLLKQYGESWLAELPAVEGARWEGFRRGIVAEVSFTDFEAMRANAHACRAVAPVEAVTVRWPRRREGRRDVPPIAELRELTLTGRASSEEEIGWLADSPQLATLRCLTARGLWEQGLRRLVASPHLSKLKSLRMPSSSNLGHAGILVLTRASSLISLEELDLSGRGVSERYSEDPLVRSPGMEALASWPGLATVRSLNLSGNDVGRVGLQALLRSKYASSLKELSVRTCRLDGQSMAEFDTAAKGLQLETLDLGENVLKDVGAEYVALVPCLRELKSLRLDRCEISLTGARLFAKKASFLDGLRILDIGHNHFGPAGLGNLLSRKPKALHTLHMRNNDLHDEGAALLAGSAASHSLMDVDLSQNGLGTIAAKVLGESEHLPGLLVLRLADNPLNDSAHTFAASPLGKRLTVLDNLPF